MQINREINISLINALQKKITMCDLLTGSGVRGIRLLKETNYIKHCTFVDINSKATAAVQNNCTSNNISRQSFTILNQGANLALLNSKGFDYIDIDPFGTPIMFLDAACKRISKDGILAVTATDTSALCGTYINACKRKYWATPLHNSMMHEIGIRILIRKIQLIAFQYEKAPIPLFSHSTRHYMRVYFKVEKGKKKINELQKKHGLYHNAGPLWLGSLWDNTLLKNMKSNHKQTQQLMTIIQNESKIQTVGFQDIHALCSTLKMSVPKTSLILNKIIAHNHKAAETHFHPYGIRTTMENIELIKLLKILGRTLSK